MPLQFIEINPLVLVLFVGVILSLFFVKNVLGKF